MFQLHASSKMQALGLPLGGLPLGGLPLGGLPLSAVTDTVLNQTSL